MDPDQNPLIVDEEDKIRSNQELEKQGPAQKKRRRRKMDVEDVDITPPQRVQILYEQALKLATMPRKKLDEFVQGAFWAAVATAASGIAGFIDMISDKATQPKLLDLSEVLIFAVCVALAITGAFRATKTETAAEYLSKTFRDTKSKTKT